MAIPRLLDTRAAAAALGVTTACLEAWRLRGGGPRYRKVGRLVRYTEADIEAFLTAGARGGEPERGVA